MNVHVHLILDKDIKDKIEILAKKEKRSTNNMINLILDKYVAKKQL